MCFVPLTLLPRLFDQRGQGILIDFGDVLRLQRMRVIDDLLRVAGGREDCALVVLQHIEP
jgi:hypothetical protein